MPSAGYSSPIHSPIRYQWLSLHRPQLIVLSELTVRPINTWPGFSEDNPANHCEFHGKGFGATTVINRNLTVKRQHFAKLIGAKMKPASERAC